MNFLKLNTDLDKISRIVNVHMIIDNIAIEQLHVLVKTTNFVPNQLKNKQSIIGNGSCQRKLVLQYKYGKSSNCSNNSQLLSAIPNLLSKHQYNLLLLLHNI